MTFCDLFNILNFQPKKILTYGEKNKMKKSHYLVVTYVRYLMKTEGFLFVSHQIKLQHPKMEKE
jgi:hypothetical protein